MTLLYTDTNRLSSVVKHEYEPTFAYCREVVTAYEGSALTYTMGTVLGKTLTSGVGTATAGTNTGNGTMGAVTVAGTASVGTYTLKITKAATNAGDFEVTGPTGKLVGLGTVAVAYSGGGLSFTLADGSTDFVVGDTFTIAVTGTYQYKRVEATATDGTQTATAIYIADTTGHYGDLAVPATTATKVLVLDNGPAIVRDTGLVFGTSVSSGALKQVQYDALAALGIKVATGV